ncbi:MAG: hypothetical protein M0Q01_00945 [Syntrophales bacterium]|nr:hypothetical protein [Syntrophales bacterium]
MTNLSLEIRNACEKKIAMLQQEIEKLREGMKTVLDALKEDNGRDQELDPTAKATGSNPVQQQFNHPIAETDVDAEPNTRHRMLLAIDKMPSSGFGTAELLKTINLDGNTKSVNKNRALRIFNDLIKSGEITVLKKRSGNQGGVYKKAAVVSEQESSLSLFNPSNFVEDEKGGSNDAH